MAGISIEALTGNVSETKRKRAYRSGVIIVPMLARIPDGYDCPTFYLFKPSKSAPFTTSYVDTRKNLEVDFSYDGTYLALSFVPGKIEGFPHLPKSTLYFLDQERYGARKGFSFVPGDNTLPDDTLSPFKYSYAHDDEDAIIIKGRIKEDDLDNVLDGLLQRQIFFERNTFVFDGTDKIELLVDMMIAARQYLGIKSQDD
ncbi:MAG: hypothetical protein QF632_03885 [Candidatus Woesearchaeota archaeon]|jgi:hypothetical protein|nr:hypothetical protein [Candidatus Woesearchaeota archaeon]MDP7323871.1 hypothetical protein [Candidatus Woesearchaeota archaeon]MDP7458358.1 hypothetical protein [Candidatus Woesearchaeota archaeon]|tara:strand:+ start:309 stop:908 length:600 start_codon:yes stop_codon:yes gene_type:complete